MQRGHEKRRRALPLVVEELDTDGDWQQQRREEQRRERTRARAAPVRRERIVAESGDAKRDHHARTRADEAEATLQARRLR